MRDRPRRFRVPAANLAGRRGNQRLQRLAQNADRPAQPETAARRRRSPSARWKLGLRCTLGAASGFAQALIKLPARLSKLALVARGRDRRSAMDDLSSRRARGRRPAVDLRPATEPLGASPTDRINDAPDPRRQRFRPGAHPISRAMRRASSTRIFGAPPEVQAAVIAARRLLRRQRARTARTDTPPQ